MLQLLSHFLPTSITYFLFLGNMLGQKHYEWNVEINNKFAENCELKTKKTPKHNLNIKAKTFGHKRNSKNIV